MSRPEKGDNGKIYYSRNGVYGIVPAKIDSSSTSCACNKLFCAEECVTITKEANICEDLKYDIMVKMNHSKWYLHGITL